MMIDIIIIITDMPAYEDEEHLSNCMRQYKDVGGRWRDLRDIWQRLD